MCVYGRRVYNFLVIIPLRKEINRPQYANTHTRYYNIIIILFRVSDHIFFLSIFSILFFIHGVNPVRSTIIIIIIILVLLLFMHVWINRKNRACKRFHVILLYKVNRIDVKKKNNTRSTEWRKPHVSSSVRNLTYYSRTEACFKNIRFASFSYFVPLK